MSNDVIELRKQVEDLKAENERLQKRLAVVTKMRDEYSRELLDAFPPPNYTEAEIADFINNRAPAIPALNEIRARYGDQNK